MFWSQNSTEFISLPSLPVQNSHWRIESEPAGVPAVKTGLSPALKVVMAPLISIRSIARHSSIGASHSILPAFGAKTPLTVLMWCTQ